jgi:GNAT superfamily N-acetyltransferase
VPAFEIRPANANDLPRLMALDHSSLTDYVWQLELRREPAQTTASFREVRLPRSVEVKYPREPGSLREEWAHKDVILLVVASEHRRRGAASALLDQAQEWAIERSVRSLILEMQSKNQAYIRLAQKFGYEFCGYNDRYYATQDVALFFGRAVKP